MGDRGTPGPRGLEVNLVGSIARAGNGRTSGTLLDANLGIGDRLQLKYERPYVTEGAEGRRTQKGIGATEIGVKWRMVDHDRLQIAFYPQYQFDDGFALWDEDGSAEASEGRSLYGPVLISKQVKHVYSVAANLGFRRDLERRGDDANLALGVGRAVGGDGRILTEVFSERDSQLRNRQTHVRVGYVFMLFPHAIAKSRIELPAFASIGHSIGRAEVGERSVSFTLGLSFIRKPKGD